MKKIISLLFIIKITRLISFGQVRDIEEIKIYENKYLNYLSGSISLFSLQSSVYNMNFSVDPSISVKKNNFILNASSKHSYFNGAIRRVFSSKRINKPIINRRFSNSFRIDVTYLFNNEFPKNSSTSRLEGFSLGIEKGLTEYFFDTYEPKEIDCVYLDNNESGKITINPYRFTFLSDYYIDDPLNSESYEAHRSSRSIFSYLNYQFITIGYSRYYQLDYREIRNGKTTNKNTINQRIYCNVLFNIKPKFNNILIGTYPIEGSDFYSERLVDINSEVNNSPIGVRVGMERLGYDNQKLNWSIEGYFFPGSLHSIYPNLGIDFKIRYTICKGFK